MVAKTRWLLTFFLLFPLASAASETCSTTLQHLGAKQSQWDREEGAVLWSIKLTDLLPLLSTIAGIRDLSPVSFAGNSLEPIDLTYRIGVACFKHYLFLSKSSDYLVTIDLKAKKKLSGVPVFAIPTQVWQASGSVYAVDLATGLEPQSAILDIETGAIYFNPGPAKFGGDTIALVVPDQAVLIQSYNWGAPSARGSISLFLFSLQGSLEQQTLEMMPACTVNMPKNFYQLRYSLVKTAIVMWGVTNEDRTVSKPLAKCANLVALLRN